MTSENDVVAICPPPVALIGTALELEVAALDTLTVRVEVTAPPQPVGPQPRGFGLNPPVTPAGKIAARVTGELNPPVGSKVTMTLPDPPGLRTRPVGFTERVNWGVAVTVNAALADLPVLPNTIIV